MLIDGKQSCPGPRRGPRRRRGVVRGRQPEARARHGARRRRPCLGHLRGEQDQGRAEAGIESFPHRLAAETTQTEVVRLLAALGADERVSGILLQLPTPKQINGSHLTTLIEPEKDVDGLTPVSAGLLAKGMPGLRPCTPEGVIELLARYEVPMEGAEAVVLGRSDLVGKPVAALLLAENATVTMCHSRTRDLARCAGARTC